MCFFISGLRRLVSASPEGYAQSVVGGGHTGSDPASHGARGLGSSKHGGSTMLVKRIQRRAKSLSDGGWSGGDARCAESLDPPRNFLDLRVRGRVELAGIVATLTVATGAILAAGADHSHLGSRDLCLVSASPEGYAQSVVGGGHTGSDPASHGARGLGSSRKLPPSSLL